MSLVNRDLLAFPAGDNSSDTLIDGTHWNLTTLKHWSYTYYSNGTLSNGSSCFLLFEPYTPHLLQNGTFLNSTSCYSPTEPVKTRSKVGLLFVALFGISIIFTLINLRKHGKLFLPTERRFRAVGRRWQWYWMLAVAAFAIISGIAAVDVDRYFLPELPIVLNSFFWFLMLPTTMCVVWENVRHWGSWQERQMVDPDPFLLSQDDCRSKVEFYLPLTFYFSICINLFMGIPRSWGPIELQRDSNQSRLRAAPTATDIRFKLAAFFLLGSWLVVVYSLQHSIYHYKARNRGLFNRTFGLLRYTPLKFLLTLPFSLIMIGYAIVVSFNFDINPLNIKVNLGYMYGLGWAPIAAILLVFEVAGYVDPNEDRDLIRQRRIREAEVDQEMGITRKPHWWSTLHGDNQKISVRDHIARNVSEVKGKQVTTKSTERNVEMRNIPLKKEINANKPVEETGAVEITARLLSPIGNGNVETQERGKLGTADNRPSEAEESNVNPNTGSGIPLKSKPQIVRSMLDV